MAQDQTINGAAPRKKRLWVVWLLFFFQFAAIGVYFIYLNMFYRNSGLSGTQIGLINMTTALLGKY